ncbi:AAA family ATPase [Thermoleptolyngbya sichuanensis A183]|uniref:Replication-associated recombination protein A n=1 Tax=Thermoleptolyngbya sichuanensis A183 TaxID=2737172 RepID=A0A6M8B1C2_9CYAN|nr:AAA family ATPase [Thermoleptolyngbya sichuanensis]QKD80819.1 AAA family ATPase [Thermoleptolyngbya sichuanensis A183]
MDLFEQHRQQITAAEAPLAARMRPRTLAEYIGQEHILGEGRLLRRAIQADQLSSLIFYGPPGTGKTTLAMVIANTTRARFLSINAVLAGVKEIREAIALAQETRGMYGQRTILFVDEVHRFNKSQQDALLPWVENGTVILIGATTENPYFEVNKALVSRSRVFQLKPLTEQDLERVLDQALQEGDRGYGTRQVQIDPDARTHLINVANGDARTLLNALELAVETTPANSEGTIHVTLEVAEESIQKRAVLYDKEGDAHFDTISAFIKSLRGSDPDAALYWLARMVYAGEDPRFIFRRMLILAGEDVGMADPNAVVVVHACAEAFDRVGMPEGRYPLAQAALYLATCPKSNSVMAFFDALAAVEREREAEVPTHLRDANRDKDGFGHGKGYLYPHSYREHWVAQQYLPGSLQGQVFYQPSEQGYEGRIQQDVARRREAQLAALVEGVGVALPEVLTFGPADAGVERWLQRTLSQSGERLAQVRDRLFALAPPQRHHLILDLNAGSGLLTWEAVRLVPEGGVYACAPQQQDAAALQEQSAALPELLRPVVLHSAIADLPAVLHAECPSLRFERLMGRNVFLNAIAPPDTWLQAWKLLLQPEGYLLLAETIPRHTQRLHQLIPSDRIPSRLLNRWRKAEEQLYESAAVWSMTWNVQDLETLFDQAGFTAEIALEHTQTELLISPALIDRWFASASAKPTYAEQIREFLSDADLNQIQTLLRQCLSHQTVQWQGAIAFVKAQSKPSPSPAQVQPKP